MNCFGLLLKLMKGTGYLHFIIFSLVDGIHCDLRSLRAVLLTRQLHQLILELEIIFKEKMSSFEHSLSYCYRTLGTVYD